MSKIAYPKSGNLLRLDSKSLEKICQEYSKLSLRLQQPGNAQEMEDAIDRLDAFQRNLDRFIALVVEDKKRSSTLYYFSIAPLRNVRKLQLQMCPPTTVLDLFSLRSKLEILEITNSGISELHKVLVPVDDKYLKQCKPMIMSKETVLEIPTSLCWSKLTHVRIANCGVARLDQCFHFMPNIVYLDMSFNEITHLVHLQDCVKLSTLDISYNRIRILSNIGRVLGNITDLDISHNRVQSLDGIEKVFALQKLDVSANLINDFGEIRYLSALPCLEKVRLLGNAIATHPNYRILALERFIVDGTVMSSSREMPQLDGLPLTKIEAKHLKSITFRALETEQRDRPHAPILSRFGLGSNQDCEEDLSDEGECEQAVQADNQNDLTAESATSVTPSLEDGILTPSVNTTPSQFTSPIRSSFNSPNPSPNINPSPTPSPNPNPNLSPGFGISPGITYTSPAMTSASGFRKLSTVSRGSIDGFGAWGGSSRLSVASTNRYSTSSYFVDDLPLCAQLNRGYWKKRFRSKKPIHKARRRAVIADSLVQTKKQSLSGAPSRESSDHDPVALAAAEASTITKFVPPDLTTILESRREVRRLQREKELEALAAAERKRIAELEEALREQQRIEDARKQAEAEARQREEDARVEAAALAAAKQVVGPFSSPYGASSSGFDLTRDGALGGVIDEETGEEVRTIGAFTIRRSVEYDANGSPMHASGSVKRDTSGGGVGGDDNDRQSMGPLSDQRGDIITGILSQSSFRSDASGLDNENNTSKSNKSIKSPNRGKAKEKDKPESGKSKAGVVRRGLRSMWNMRNAASSSDPASPRTPPSAESPGDAALHARSGRGSSTWAAAALAASNTQTQQGSSLNSSSQDGLFASRASFSEAIVSGGVGAGSGEVVGASLSNDPNDDFDNMKHVYVGDPDYKDLLIADNLELYFREQVFHAGRPSGTAAYLSKGPSFLSTGNNAADAMLAAASTSAGAAASCGTGLGDCSNTVVGSSSSGWSFDMDTDWAMGLASFRNFVAAPPRPEGFYALYYANVVELVGDDDTGDAPSSQAAVDAAPSKKSLLSSRFRRTSTGAVPQSSGVSLPTPPPQVSSQDPGDGAGASSSSEPSATMSAEIPVTEHSLLIVITDVCLYLVYQHSIPPDARFQDVPIPLVFRVHPLHHLRKTSIYFGFQRCALQFSINSSTATAKSQSYVIHAPKASNSLLFPSFDAVSRVRTESGTVYDDFRSCPLFAPYSVSIPGCRMWYSYHVLTRDKAKTYPIVTQIPQLANAAVCLEDKDTSSSNNPGSSVSATPASPDSAQDDGAMKPEAVGDQSAGVTIINRNVELVEALVAPTAARGCDSDIVHYQMLFQCWRLRPGVLIARTLIITPSLLLLCYEDLQSLHVKLKVLDVVSPKEIVSIKAEDQLTEPLYVTIVIKPSKVFSATRKWRLKTDTMPSLNRLLEEVQRICSQHGNNDV